MKKLAAALLVITLIFSFTACGNPTVERASESSDVEVENFDFWHENNILVLTKVDVEADSNQPSIENEISKLKAVDYQKNSKDEMTFGRLIYGINSFFLNNYNIDVAEKMSQMDIAPFEAETNITGYTIPGESKIHLNSSLLGNGEEKEFLEETFLHESMHYLRGAEGSSLEEGLAEYMAQKCAEYIGIEYTPSEEYAAHCRIVETLFTANPDLEKELFSSPDFTLEEEVTSKTCDFPQIYQSVEDCGQFLNVSADFLNLSHQEMDEEMLLNFTVQEILTAYAKSFEPSEEQISKIRNLYFVDNFEELALILRDEFK